uniref:RecF/RecN/SMC N-terminal domain-containing protein n=1 Tax=Physcomitrium patens TaxID=3218 RepID=A0A7I4AS47_PHYPA
MPALTASGRIQRLEILNFKSLKCHQVVGPFDNFAAIVSSNGAGRSDLVEAISFVLGVRSFQLQGMVQRAGLDDREHGKSRGKIAFVKLVYCTASGEEIKFGRAITSSGTSEYRINNIPVTWEIYNNTMQGLDILGEVDSDGSREFREPSSVSQPASAPDELKKIHKELETQKARKEEKLIPIDQKRKMFAAERKQKMEQKESEAEKQLRLQAELDKRAAEVRMEMEWLASAGNEMASSDFEALDSEYESLREQGRWMEDEALKVEASRKAAIEAADSWKASNQPSSRPESLPHMLNRDNAVSGASIATKAVDFTSSKSRPNDVKDVKGRKKVTDVPVISISSKGTYNDHRIEELNREYRELVEYQSQNRDGNGAEVSLELESKHSENGYSGPDAEGKNGSEMHAAADESAWIDGSARDAHASRRLEDYDDQMCGSETGEDELDPDKDSLSKAECLAEELYRDAMELHDRLVAEAEMNTAVGMCGVDGKGHSWIAETKETCGAVMYANGHVQNGKCGMVDKDGELTSAGSSESMSLSFSQTSQSSDTPASALGQTERLHGMKLELSEKGGSAQANGGSRNGGDHAMTSLVEFRGGENGVSPRSTMEKEIARLRGSNVRKQLKIDSLQKWKVYYKLEVEDRARKLAQMEERYRRELKKRERAVKKTVKAHAKEIAEREAKREGMEEKLREEIKELNRVVEELSEQLYEMEEHLASRGIQYKPSLNENTGPSSKTLLSAVIGVKEAAHTFSRTFMSHLKQHLTKARDLDEQICLESEVIVARPSDYKFLVQSFILRRMFLDFDSECFNIESCMSEIFNIEEHSKACFQEYLKHRTVSETVTLLTDNRSHSAFLREFCFKKFLHIVSESTEEAFFGDFNHSDDICAGRHPSSRFYESFLKLAVSVWLLHRLAFSFQPPARMLSVRKGAQFNPTYMESAVPGISNGEVAEGEGGALPFEALVGLMVHPGFRCGSSIIPAQVYLVTT